LNLVAKKIKGRDAYETSIRSSGFIPVHPDSHFFYK
jgi:hypothetical protein